MEKRDTMVASLRSNRSAKKTPPIGPMSAKAVSLYNASQTVPYSKKRHIINLLSVRVTALVAVERF
jgi:hypothetical protein